MEKVPKEFSPRWRMAVSSGKSGGSAFSPRLSQFTSNRLATLEVSQVDWGREGLGSKSNKRKRGMGTCGQGDFEWASHWLPALLPQALALAETSRILSRSLTPIPPILSTPLSHPCPSKPKLLAPGPWPSSLPQTPSSPIHNPSLQAGRKTSKGTELLPGCVSVLPAPERAGQGQEKDGEEMPA